MNLKRQKDFINFHKFKILLKDSLLYTTVLILYDILRTVQQRRHWSHNPNRPNTLKDLSQVFSGLLYWVVTIY